MNDELPAHQAPEPASEQARGPRRAIARRRVLQVLGGLGLAAGISYLVGRRVAPHPAAPGVASPGPPAGAAAAATPDSLDQLAHSIRHGAPGPDAMPPIDHPQFVPAAQARFLADDDVVFGLVRAGQARAYPQLVLVWHEIVNDRFPDGPLSVTYCPLTGSVLAFRGTAPSGAPYTFGTSGRPGQLQPAHVRPPDRQLLAATARPSHPGAQPRAGPRAGAPGLDQVGALAGGLPRHPGAVDPHRLPAQLRHRPLRLLQLRPRARAVRLLQARARALPVLPAAARKRPLRPKGGHGRRQAGRPASGGPQVGAARAAGRQRHHGPPAGGVPVRPGARRGTGVPGRPARSAASLCRHRHARRAAVVVAVAYLLVYLLAVGDLTVSLASDLSRFVELPSLQVAPDWTAKLLQRRAAFSYEPVLAVYPLNHVTVFVAPLDLAMGLLLGALAGLNVAVALLGWRASRACRLRGLPGLAGALPALLTGITCCVPTLALGAQLTLPLLAVSDWLFPSPGRKRDLAGLERAAGPGTGLNGRPHGATGRRRRAPRRAPPPG